jgi:hypothetical protein
LVFLFGERGLERRESVRPSLQDLNHGLLPITLAPSSKKRGEEKRREERRVGNIHT